MFSHASASLLESLIWEEVFAPHVAVKFKRENDEDPPMDSADVASICRKIDRVFGWAPSTSCKNITSAHQGLSRDDVIKRYEEMVKDRKILKKLLEAPGIEQRTPAWYAAREGLITASDFAQALGQGKFASQRDFYLKKVDPASASSSLGGMSSSPALKWGVMFEPVASDVYSARNGNIKVHEFGLLRHPTIPHIGASPDGITDAGVMVEIKCPFQRKINREVPYQYYCQIQGQLEVCGLKYCDYLECEFEKYDNFDEFVADSMAQQKNEIEESSPSHLGYSMRTGREKGIIAEFRGQRDEGSKYEYSPLPFDHPDAKLFDVVLKEWMESVEKNRPDFKEFTYWHLNTYSVLRVEADPVIIAEVLKDLDAVWKKILMYRKDRSAYDKEILQKSNSVRSTSTAKTSNNFKPLEGFAFRDD